jgi:transcriptional regulator with XRE-family HTH domain
MDLEKLEKEFLRAIRGRLSQSQLSQKLGYRSNKVYKWESGLNNMSWLEFIRVAEIRRLNFKPSVRKLLGYKGKLQNTAEFSKFLVGTVSFRDISQRLNISEGLIEKWLKGKSIPSLLQVLIMIEFIYRVLPEFIAGFVDVELVPSIADLFNKKRQQKTAIANNPALEMALVSLSLPLTSREQQIKKIAKILALSLVEAEKQVKQLLDLDLAREEGEKLVVMDGYVETANTMQGSVLIRQFWVKYIDRFLKLISSKTDEPDNFFGYEIFAMSEDASQKINQEYYAFYAKIKSIIASDKDPKTAVKFIATQILDLEKIATYETKSV